MINLLLLFAFLQMPVRSISSDHVRIYFPSNIDTSVANRYLSALEKMYVTYSSRLGIGEDGILKARLCHDGYDFSGLTSDDSVFSPLWKEGTLYAIAGSDVDNPSYGARLGTCVIRGILNRISHRGAPGWFVYSVAVYESGEYEGLTPPPMVGVKYFSDLEEKMQSVSSGSELSDLLFYLGSTGKYIDLKFGAGSVVKLLHEFDHTTSFKAAVGNSLHVTIPELETGWYRYLLSLVKT